MSGKESRGEEAEEKKGSRGQERRVMAEDRSGEERKQRRGEERRGESKRVMAEERRKE